MAAPVLTLFATNLKSWISAKGFVLVAGAALLPLLLTGAWALTHQKDVAAASISWTPDPAVEGDNVTFTATVENKGRLPVDHFNASLAVGRVIGRSLSPDAQTPATIDRLGPGDTYSIRLNWTAKAGVYVGLLDVDPDDKVGEKEEFNNQKPVALEVRYKVPAPETAPARPAGVTGNNTTGARADALVVDVAWTPSDLQPGSNTTVTATLRNDGPDALVNGSVVVRSRQLFDRTFLTSQETTRSVTLDPGASTTVDLAWNNVQAGKYWVEAFVNTTGAAQDPTDNNWLAKPLAIDQKIPASFEFPEPPERLTINAFFINILKFLQLPLLVPLIGLFYAAGVIADEREKGNLTYLLTRPISRWVIPPTKFVASYLVAGLALGIGVAATYFVLYGTKDADLSYLFAPLLVNLLALFVYGSFFVLLGVWVDRPYLVGVVFVIGWEVIAKNFVPWVANLTLSHHLSTIIGQWDPAQSLPWPPGPGPALDALRNLLIAAVAFLVIASVVMKRREFEA